MAKWNVLVGVVSIVEAPDKETAIRALESNLKGYGYNVYDSGLTAIPHAFESEDDE